MYTRLETQKFLQESGSLEDLQATYGIKNKRHPQYPNLVLLKYSMYDSLPHSRIVQECRGLILDEDRDWQAVSVPFFRFFNIEEPNAADIDWGYYRAYEKIDGSLICCYWYDNQWQIQSSGTPDASATVPGCDVTLRNLFLQTLKDRGYSLPDPVFCNMTLMFELTSKYNRVIVKQGEPDIRFIGARLTNTDDCMLRFREVDIHAPQWYARYWTAPPRPGVYAGLPSKDYWIKRAATLDPYVSEGFVLVDKHHNRVKVKSPGYVALHHCKGATTPTALLELILKGEDSEFVAHFPEWHPQIKTIQEALDALVEELEDIYEVQSKIVDAGTFARVIKLLTPFTAPLFAVKHGRASSIRDFLRNYNAKNLADILKIKNIVLPGAGGGE
jgi:hypothetical protein